LATLGDATQIEMILSSVTPPKAGQGKLEREGNIAGIIVLNFANRDMVLSRVYIMAKIALS
jgi:hypothetical protein